MSTTPGRATKLKSYIHQDKATVLVTDKIFRQIQIMHNLAKGNEWSGILFYRIIAGEIDDPANLVLRLEEVLPMDIGNPTYTEYDFDLLDPVVSNAVERTLDDPTLKYGHMHSHQDMDCFFSGTDVDECEDNADKYDHYVSIIINKKNDMEKNWCGRICINGEEEVSGNVSVTTKYNSGLGRVETTPISKKERIIKNIDCIIKPDPNSFWEDIDRSNAILTKKETVVVKTNSLYGGQSVNSSPITTTYGANMVIESKRGTMTKKLITNFLFDVFNCSSVEDFKHDNKTVTEESIRLAFNWFKSEYNNDPVNAIELFEDNCIKTFRKDIDSYYRHFKHTLLWADYVLCAKMIILVLKNNKFPDELLVKLIEKFGHNIKEPSVGNYTEYQVRAYTNTNNKELRFLMQDFDKYSNIIDVNVHPSNDDDIENKNFWDRIKSDSLSEEELINLDNSLYL